MIKDKEIPKPFYYRREKTPTIIQMENVECGPTALSIILAYYGKFIPLEELRIACGVSRDGSNALSILETAQKYGLLCEAYTVELESLYDMPLPIVAFWNFNHFVVIEGFSRKYVFINDPAIGPVKISYEDFNSSFTGLILIFEPSIDFKKSGQQTSFWEIISRRFSKIKLPFIFSFLTGLCLIIPELALPAFTQVFIDNILINKIFSWQGWFIFSMFFVALLAFIFKFLQEIILSRLIIKLSITSTSEFLWHILRLPLSFYSQRYSGEIANRLQLNEDVTRSIKQLISNAIDATVAVIFALVMFYYDAVIAFFGIAMVMLDFFLVRYLYQSRSDAYAYYQQTRGKSIAYSINILESIETVKATGSEIKLFGRWAGYYTKGINAIQEIAKKDILAGVIPIFLQTLTTILILCLGSWRVMQGHLTIGMLMALTILMQSFINPITRLVNLNMVIQLLKVNMVRLDDVLKSPIDHQIIQSEKTEAKLALQFPYVKLKGQIEVRHLTFGFNPLADPIIEDINFSLPPGKMVALVGPTGCGKSTIAKLIAGLLEPWKGELLFDHTLRSQIPRKVITNSLSVVEQESHLFSGTVKENIAFFNPLVNQQDIIKAAKDACIHDDILLRKGGYDLQLEHDGINLSGGQKQRLEIAHALVNNPSILILDEATSALDSKTELEIMQNIRKRGCTSLIIAHRLQSIRHCDEIFVIDKGRIIQKGSHSELIEIPGLYKTLTELEQDSSTFITL